MGHCGRAVKEELIIIKETKDLQSTTRSIPAPSGAFMRTY